MARRHNPAVNWQGANIPAAANAPFSDFPADYGRLPTVSLVIPNMRNDMHDGPVRDGDSWLRTHMEPYVRWAAVNNSLLIVTQRRIGSV